MLKIADVVPGSPPRMWGIRYFAPDLPMLKRITPTYVGNTLACPRRDAGVQDHPHVCREYFPSVAAHPVVKGSPPRMWGIHPAQFGNAALKRITPTYVGNTPCHRLIYPLYKDHPHVCGEYNHRTISFGPSLGSPPRMWGIPLLNVTLW